MKYHEHQNLKALTEGLSWSNVLFYKDTLFQLFSMTSRDIAIIFLILKFLSMLSGSSYYFETQINLYSQFISFGYKYYTLRILRHSLLHLQWLNYRKPPIKVRLVFIAVFARLVEVVTCAQMCLVKSGKKEMANACEMLLLVPLCQHVKNMFPCALKKLAYTIIYVLICINTIKRPFKK